MQITESQHEQHTLASLTARFASIEQLHQEELKERDALIHQRDVQIKLLIEQLRLLKAQKFGGSSEQVSPDQLRLLFNEAELLSPAPAVSTETATITIPAYERKKRGRKALPADLPRIEVIHDLAEREKVCAHEHCGSALQVIGQETSEQLDYIPARIRVLKHIRLKYACPGCDQSVKIADKPAQLLPKSNATPSLLAHIVTAKYVDGTPLYRQEAQFKRIGIDLPRSTQANWMMKLGDAVIPLINLMHDHCMAQPLIHMDETPLQVLKSDKSSTSTHYMWVSCAGPPQQKSVLFDYDPSRGAQVPKRLLQDYQGILMTDGYSAYDAVVNEHSLRHAGCWAHVQRKFDEARTASLNQDPLADTALHFIKQLYQVERHIKHQREQRTSRNDILNDDEVVSLRQQHSTPIITPLKAWLDTHVHRILPQSSLGKAIAYTLNQWPKLVHFLNHAIIPLDNNRCENAIRPFVIGRKNWLFCDTQPGAIASARLYSLIETAKANGLEPHAYLTRLFTLLPAATCLTDFEALLPFKINTDQPQ